MIIAKLTSSCRAYVSDKQKQQMQPVYNFKFLEIFSQKDLFEECIINNIKISDCEYDEL